MRFIDADPDDRTRGLPSVVIRLAALAPWPAGGAKESGAARLAGPGDRTGQQTGPGARHAVLLLRTAARSDRVGGSARQRR